MAERHTINTFEKESILLTAKTLLITLLNRNTKLTEMVSMILAWPLSRPSLGLDLRC